MKIAFHMDKMFLSDDRSKSNGTTEIKIFRPWWLVVAIIVVGLAGRFLFPGQEPTPQQLYGMFSEHDFDLTVKSTADEKLVEIEKLLKSEKYEEAIPVIDSYLANDTENNKIILIKGIACLELAKYEDALQLFKSLETQESFFRTEALWYQGLAFLKNGDASQAVSYFDQIEKSSSRYDEVIQLTKYLND